MKAVALACLPFVVLCACAPSSFADTLKGTSVKGVLHVDGSSINDFSPTTATVGPGIEFNAIEFTSPFDNLCEYTANVSAAKISIKDVCGAALTTDAALAPDAFSSPKAPFTITLTDRALTGDTIAALENGLDLSYSLTGDKLTFTFDDLDTTGNRSTFAVTSAAVTPEPASWQLLMLGLAAAGLLGYTSKNRAANGRL